jgi:hypothetical protein
MSELTEPIAVVESELPARMHPNRVYKYPGVAHRHDVSGLSQDPMMLREQIRQVSQRLRRPAMPHKEFMELNHLLLQLRGLLKKRHDRSENGIRFKDIIRDEAKAKREALAKEKENGA